MAIKIGGSTGKAKLRLNAQLETESTLDITIGGARDMSVHEINIFERHRDDLEVALAQLKFLASQARAQHAHEALLRDEALKLAGAVEKTIEKRKWYSLSAAGVLGAAKALGETATPVATAATKVVELVRAMQS